ncbi:MAG: ATP-binding protein [Bacteroidales bacterium]|nr:ATP-binding protein [Bacteroidales bacterium]
MIYKKRILDKILERKLMGCGAVLMEGPKWCGKTTTCEQQAKSVLYMSDPEHKSQYLRLANINIKKLLEGDTPRLIDEWQVAPKFWDAIRFDVDHREGDGLYMLTGSSVPPEASKDEMVHSGTGRIARLTMRPMSLYESGESNGEVSLGALFNGETDGLYSENRLDLSRIAYLICRGGWPKATLQSEDIALDRAFEYFDAVANVDASRVDGVQRDPDRVKRLMRSYARQQGTQTALAVIRADMLANDSSTLDEDTVNSYIKALKKIFVIEDMQAWNPNLRSKTAIRTSDTRYYVDPSVATAALGLGPQDLINDLETMGLFFETLCVRDLRVYADALDGKVYHYRDKSGLECDAVLHLRNGKYGLVEIKLGGDDLISAGAETLKELAVKIDTTKMKSPSFLMVLTGTGDFAYRREEDGVLVVPIGCLKN